MVNSTEFAWTSTDYAMISLYEGRRLNASVPQFGIDALNDSTPLKLLLVVLYSAIFAVGTSGNALVVTVVARNKILQSPTNIFIANLALSDVLMCLLAVPFTPLNGMISSWVLGEPLCRMVAMSSALSVHVSTQTSTAIAVDRYFAIVHPFKARLTARRCLFVIGLVWLLSLSFSLPLALYQQVERVKDTTEYTCNENWPDIKWVRIFTLASLGLQYLLPCSVISVCYSRVYSALSRRIKNKRHMLRQRKSVNIDKTGGKAAAKTVIGYVPANGSIKLDEGSSFDPNAADLSSSKNMKRSLATVTLAPAAISKENQELRRKRRTTNMLIAMVAIFVGCWLPLNVVMLTFDYAEDSLKFWPYRLLTFFLAHVIAMSSTVYNPFLYAWLNEAFREEFRKLLPPFLFSCLTCRGCFQCERKRREKKERATHIDKDCLALIEGGNNAKQTAAVPDPNIDRTEHTIHIAEEVSQNPSASAPLKVDDTRDTSREPRSGERHLVKDEPIREKRQPKPDIAPTSNG